VSEDKCEEFLNRPWPGDCTCLDFGPEQEGSWNSFRETPACPVHECVRRMIVPIIPMEHIEFNVESIWPDMNFVAEEEK
jgi:hypothetical protein